LGARHIPRLNAKRVQLLVEAIYAYVAYFGIVLMRVKLNGVIRTCASTGLTTDA